MPGTVCHLNFFQCFINLLSAFTVSHPTVCKRQLDVFKNGEVPDEMRDLTQGQIAIKLSRLADEVLRVVEQDLRSGGPQSPDETLEPVVVG